MVHRLGYEDPSSEASDLNEARAATRELLSLLPNLRVVVLLGRHAANAWGALGLELDALEAPHPSPLSLNTSPERRQEIRRAFVEAKVRADAAG